MKSQLALLSLPRAGADALERPVPAKVGRAADAAQQFEEIFLRKMLSSLMKTAKLGSAPQRAGGEMYDSMIVDALASSLAQGGGIGLAPVIERGLAATGRGDAERSGEALAGGSGAGDPQLSRPESAQGLNDGVNKSSSISRSDRSSELEVIPGDRLTRSIR